MFCFCYVPLTFCATQKAGCCLHIYSAQSSQVCRTCCKASASRSSPGTRPQAPHQHLEEVGAEISSGSQLKAHFPKHHPITGDHLSAQRQHCASLPPKLSTPMPTSWLQLSQLPCSEADLCRNSLSCAGLAAHPELQARLVEQHTGCEAAARPRHTTQAEQAFAIYKLTADPAQEILSLRLWDSSEEL